MIAFSGHLRLTADCRPDGRTMLAEQAFRAPFHLSKPYWDPEARTLLVQVVNPTAGILAGDVLEAAVTVASGAALLVTTPSANRLFRMGDGQAQCRQYFRVEAGGWLEFAPEPIVPHRGSRYRQATHVDVAPGGRGVFVEQLIPGRLAHGEAWGWAELELNFELRIGQRLVLRERLDRSGEQLRVLSRVFGAKDTTCFATVVIIDTTSAAESASAWHREAVALQGPECHVGVSALSQGGWTIKVVADGPVRLRDTLTRLRGLLASTYPELRTSFRRY